jgi:uncharacterized protein
MKMRSVDRLLLAKIQEVRAPIRAKGATGLYVYGSRARGDHRPESDIDVLVDYDPSSDFSIVELAAIKRILEQALDLKVHVTTRNSLSSHLQGEVERQAVRVL